MDDHNLLKFWMHYFYEIQKPQNSFVVFVEIMLLLIDLNTDQLGN